MDYMFFPVRQWYRPLCILTLLLVAPSAGAVILMPSGVPYFSAGAGIFNLVGAVDDDGYNHTRPSSTRSTSPESGFMVSVMSWAYWPIPMAASMVMGAFMPTSH